MQSFVESERRVPGGSQTACLCVCVYIFFLIIEQALSFTEKPILSYSCVVLRNVTPILTVLSVRSSGMKHTHVLMYVHAQDLRLAKRKLRPHRPRTPLPHPLSPGSLCSPFCLYLELQSQAVRCHIGATHRWTWVDRRGAGRPCTQQVAQWDNSFSRDAGSR